MRLFRSQKTPKCVKKNSWNGYRLVPVFHSQQQREAVEKKPGNEAGQLFLPHFDFICDIFLNRSTATWNLFVKMFPIKTWYRDHLAESEYGKWLIVLYFWYTSAAYQALRHIYWLLNETWLGSVFLVYQFTRTDTIYKILQYTTAKQRLVKKEVQCLLVLCTSTLRHKR